jgi:hypothetical protein
MMTSASPYNLAVLITGIDNTIGTQRNIDFLTKFVPHVMVIGDGQETILNAQEQGPLVDSLANLHHNYPDLRAGRTLVYIDMHGIIDDTGPHILSAGPDNDLLTSGLFGLLNQVFATPVNIIFLPCHGKGALPDIDELSAGSRIMMFSEAGMTTIASNHLATQKALMDHTAEQPLTLDSYFAYYLANLSQPERPIIATVGGDITDPYRLAMQFVGHSISDAAREYVHQHFGQEICHTDAACYQHIDHVISRMEQPLAMSDFAKFDNQHFVDILDKVGAMINSGNSTDTCTTGWYDDKKQIDQLFVQHHLPFELNLENLSYYSHGDKNVDTILDDEDIVLLRESSVKGAANFLASMEPSIIDTNYHYPIPGDHYGWALGISHALDQFAHLQQLENY